MNEKDIGMLIKQLNDAKEKIVNEQLKDLGLTFSQFRFLVYVRECNGKAVSLKKIERCFYLTQQTVAGVIKRLEDKGFVCACEDEADKRVKKVFLTSKGEESCNNAMDCYQTLQDLLTRGLSQSEQQELYRLLEIVLENVKLGIEIMPEDHKDYHCNITDFYGDGES